MCAGAFSVPADSVAYDTGDPKMFENVRNTHTEHMHARTCPYAYAEVDKMALRVWAVMKPNQALIGLTHLLTSVFI